MPHAGAQIAAQIARRVSVRATGRDRSAYTLVETAAVVAVAGTLAMLAWPVLDAWRTEARLAGSRDNLATLGKANAAHGAANDGMISGYDWGPEDGASSGPFGDLTFDMGNGAMATAQSRLEIAQFQQAAILRRHTGRYEDSDDRLWFNTGRVPHRRYSHLPMLDWFGGSMTDPLAVSPLDLHLQAFQAEPMSYPILPGGNPDTASDVGWTPRQVLNRWPFASSYQTTTYAWSPSRPTEDFTNGRMPIEPGGDGTLFRINEFDSFGVQDSADVSFPALKAHMFEEFDYTEGLGVNGRFYADPAASVNVLFFDGSARLVATEDTNPGWDPGNICDQTATTSLPYEPIDTRYFPEYSDAELPQPYRWTRGGLEGIDVGAGEINTENWCE